MQKPFTASLTLLLVVVLFVGACSSDSPNPNESVADTETPPTPADQDAPAIDEDDDEDDDGGATTAIAAGPVEAEIFSSDEGAGCGIYVSVQEAVVTSEVNAREMIWRSLVDNNFQECDFSDVEEVGLITVRDLDEYEQPDWSTVIEHDFFAVQGWTELVEQCFSEPLPSGCPDLLETSLTP